ncbi:hypothetical protein PMAYCL1PPCAC_20880 [Pristionchus mayeri]|uniref:Fatty acid hydroxylase domain-containing protein n=1 Tax=Pristionchus mayeri TaxID=1317129 RepID=A0AAN5I418_9BILA|nr:hypothetical protein PMAYCL1PPCAC_20880 [Pristionchus mayeri]
MWASLLEAFHWQNLGYFFFLTDPWKLQSYTNIEDIPQYIELAKSWAFLLMALEILFNPDSYSFPDTITSICSGLASMQIKIQGLGITAFLYPYVWQYIHIVDLTAAGTLSTWLICFLFQDFVYYLGHRAIHEWGFMWGFHTSHHSSEYYNLSTALRQGAIQEFAMMFFDFIQAIIVPPTMYIPHKALSLLYGLWIHTNAMPYLGPLEYILNTPSAHRVHHGRNPYCIDRNYGGTLIIFDRIFGTYAKERDEEPVVYGLVSPSNTFNQLRLQTAEFKYYLFTKPFLKNEDGTDMFPGWPLKIKTMFAPPGAYPGTDTKQFFLWRCMKDNEEGIPAVNKADVAPFYKNVGSFAKLYLIAQFFAVVFINFTTVLSPDYLPSSSYDAVIVYIIVAWSIQSFGYYFDHEYPFSIKFDCARLLFIASMATLIPTTVHASLMLPYAMVSLGALAVLYTTKSVPGQTETEKIRSHHE